MVENSNPITVAKILELLEQAVASKPEGYRYPKDKQRVFPKGDPHGLDVCRYWHTEDNECGCIVGFVFTELGVSARRLESVEGESARTASKLLGLHLEDLALDVLREAQSQQDNDKTWDEAVDAAYEEADVLRPMSVDNRITE